MREVVEDGGSVTSRIQEVTIAPHEDELVKVSHGPDDSRVVNGPASLLTEAQFINAGIPEGLPLGPGSRHLLPDSAVHVRHFSLPVLLKLPLETGDLCLVGLLKLGDFLLVRLLLLLPRGDLLLLRHCRRRVHFFWLKEAVKKVPKKFQL